MPKNVLTDMKAHMDRTVEDLRREFQKIRTGRANTALLDDVRVE